MSERILIVEDELAVAEAVAYSLGQEGFEVSVAADGPSALKAFERDKPDLVVLDLMLPGINGWDLFGAFRKQRGRVPVVMLTARADEPDRVAGLEMGADDYVTKPFSMRELVARVRSVLRRATGDGEDTPAVLQSGALRLDADRHEATLGGEVLTLSPKEFALLEYLMRHSGRARSREDILQAVWGTDDYLDERTVDVHMRWLRMKIEAEPSQPLMLLTVRGIGYKFTDAP